MSGRLWNLVPWQPVRNGRRSGIEPDHPAKIRRSTQVPMLYLVGGVASLESKVVAKRGGMAIVSLSFPRL